MGESTGRGEGGCGVGGVQLRHNLRDVVILRHMGEGGGVACVELARGRLGTSSLSVACLMAILYLYGV